ncbi:hypothetical protein Taro_018681 [Colocasia esculenta]|uniref:Peroxisomal membrane protein 11C n=1 Tax=Colocasia esculenta TaxID=4460 RepID=A0A843URD3_COLES|nr:hypothetical protein [Colocasia esculenta]
MQSCKTRTACGAVRTPLLRTVGGVILFCRTRRWIVRDPSSSVDIFWALHPQEALLIPLRSQARRFLPHLPFLCRIPTEESFLSKMSTLAATRAELGLLVLYLNKAEARDKICRAIQYGSKFLSNGEPGTAQNVDKSTSLARKVFRLLKFVNDLHALISPPAQGTPLSLILLGKSKNALLSTFLLLDQVVWAGRTGIYKNKERTELIGRISLFCWMGSSVCTTLIELAEIQRLSKSIKKLDKDLKQTDKYENELYQSKLKQSDERLLSLVKASLDIVVAAGLLQLAPKKVTPRVTGALGFITSLISCYQANCPMDGHQPRQNRLGPVSISDFQSQLQRPVLVRLPWVSYRLEADALQPFWSRSAGFSWSPRFLSTMIWTAAAETACL